jgi:hypothetical protein
MPPASCAFSAPAAALVAAQPHPLRLLIQFRFCHQLPPGGQPLQLTLLEHVLALMLRCTALLPAFQSKGRLRFLDWRHATDRGAAGWPSALNPLTHFC